MMVAVPVLNFKLWLCNRMQPTVLGRYEVRDILGRGNMGVVYRGHDPVIDRPVALKTVLLPESIADAEKAVFLERFFQEARAAGKLTHPNVVITYDAATDAATGTPFIAMELVEGETLEERLRREGALPWEKAVDVVMAIADGLAKAHEAGIVHRDIKPANIMMGEGDAPKIADFGIAKLPTTELTQEGNIIGTPHFMSPEQLRGKPLDGRSDLFSLGALLYNLIAGHRPFDGKDPAAVFTQILHKEPKPLSEVPAGTPPPLDRVITRALAKNADERYETAVELAEDLRAVRSGKAPADASTHQEFDAHKTLVSGRQIDASSAPSGSGFASIPRKRSKTTVAALGLAVILVLAFSFRAELGREKRFWQAERAANAGELTESEAMLEALMEEDPEVARGGALIAKVSRELLVPHLPLEFGVRHNHRLGHCNGTLIFKEFGVEYVSRKHGSWEWSFRQIRDLESGGEWRVTITTGEEEMMGLVDSKRYVFELQSGPLEREIWKRYRRTFVENRRSAD